MGKIWMNNITNHLATVLDILAGGRFRQRCPGQDSPIYDTDHVLNTSHLSASTLRSVPA